MMLKEKPRQIKENYSPKINPTKSKLLETAKDIINNSSLVVFTKYQKENISLKATDLVKYNLDIEEIGGDIKVIRNSILKIALEESNLKEIAPKMRGALIINYTKNGPIALAKKINEIISYFKKDKNIKEDIPEIVFGILDGKFISANEVKTLATLPSKEVLLAQLLGTMKAPVTNFAVVLKNILNKLVWALNAVKDKKEGK
ncbi:MAG: 50S ribosomal protein L10 [bacterium]